MIQLKAKIKNPQSEFYDRTVPVVNFYDDCYILLIDGAQYAFSERELEFFEILD